jgi:hypothetical protein
MIIRTASRVRPCATLPSGYAPSGRFRSCAVATRGSWTASASCCRTLSGLDLMRDHRHRLIRSARPSCIMVGDSRGISCLPALPEPRTQILAWSWQACWVGFSWPHGRPGSFGRGWDSTKSVARRAWKWRPRPMTWTRRWRRASCTALWYWTGRCSRARSWSSWMPRRST